MGVFVKMDGGIGSGFAQLTPLDGHAARKFTLTAPADHYIVSVGCGGTEQNWKIPAYTPGTSEFAGYWSCDDISKETNTFPFHGRCTRVTG